MNQQEVMQKVKALAAQIQQSQHPSNTLEIALLKAKCVELYEHIQILVPNPIVQEVAKEVEEIIPLIEQQINTPDPLPVEKVEAFIAQIPEEVVAPPVMIEETTPVVEIPKVIESPSLHTIFSAAEKSNKEELSLHERISQSTSKNDLNEKLQAKVESLKAAISLNKKIAFVNQLFKENTVEYAKAIDKLNASAHLDEALLFFSEMKHNYGWENENELVKELQTLIEKRFGA